MNITVMHACNHDWLYHACTHASMPNGEVIKE